MPRREAVVELHRVLRLNRIRLRQDFGWKLPFGEKRERSCAVQEREESSDCAV